MKARELSQEECAVLLSKSRYGRLGLSMDDVPYVIPISFVYFKDKIYLHSRGKGKKVEFAIKNPNVCFQIDFLDNDCWSSVVAYGNVKLSDSPESKQRMFDAFIQKGMGGHGGKKFQREELEKMDMTIWEIQIREMTGREGIW
ncbi:MAG: pyridoxamine 5'-phosphate oxidase family protein [Methanotrichaceae archaeon]|nr:pyridoxamine 5'-phosphate oxidase family protein [Methanotrichaceae archaeon]